MCFGKTGFPRFGSIKRFFHSAERPVKNNQKETAGHYVIKKLQLK